MCDVKGRQRTCPFSCLSSSPLLFALLLLSLCTGRHGGGLEADRGGRGVDLGPPVQVPRCSLAGFVEHHGQHFGGTGRTVLSVLLAALNSQSLSPTSTLLLPGQGSGGRAGLIALGWGCVVVACLTSAAWCRFHVATTR